MERSIHGVQYLIVRLARENYTNSTFGIHEKMNRRNFVDFGMLTQRFMSVLPAARHSQPITPITLEDLLSVDAQEATLLVYVGEKDPRVMELYTPLGNQTRRELQTTLRLIETLALLF